MYKKLQPPNTCEDGIKIGILCRVICGAPGDNPDDADDKDCIVLKAGIPSLNYYRDYRVYYWGYIGIMENKMETIIVKNQMENEMETGII